MCNHYCDKSHWSNVLNQIIKSFVLLSRSVLDYWCVFNCTTSTFEQVWLLRDFPSQRVFVLALPSAASFSTAPHWASFLDHLWSPNKCECQMFLELRSVKLTLHKPSFLILFFFFSCSGCVGLEAEFGNCDFFSEQGHVLKHTIFKNRLKSEFFPRNKFP